MPDKTKSRVSTTRLLPVYLVGDTANPKGQAFMPTRTIETERLVLRPYQTGDVPAINEITSDPEVTRCSLLPPVPIEVTRDIVNRIVQMQEDAPPDEPPCAFVITLNGDGTLIGYCRIGRDRNTPDRADIAYYFHSRYWGQGYGTEAARALIAYGFAQFDFLRQIYALCLPENIGSRRVMEKAGMQKEEPVTLHVWHTDSNRDVTFLRYAVNRPYADSTGDVHVT
jgi:[ribosomal protein S5]-alanine N-acetyltransferase